MRTFSTKSVLQTKNKNTNIKSPSAMLRERNQVGLFCTSAISCYKVGHKTSTRQHRNGFIRFALKSHKKIMNKNSLLARLTLPIQGSDINYRYTSENTYAKIILCVMCERNHKSHSLLTKIFKYSYK